MRKNEVGQVLTAKQLRICTAQPEVLVRCMRIFIDVKEDMHTSCNIWDAYMGSAIPSL